MCSHFSGMIKLIKLRLRVMVQSSEKMYGYRPSFGRRLSRAFCRFIIYLFRLNGQSIISNEFMQMLDPKFKTEFDGHNLEFRTGNGRLFWRAKGFLDEEPLIIAWIKSMTSDDVVLDIGANVGIYSIPMAKKSKIVYACELDPLNVAILKENMYLNSLTDSIVVLPFASGDSSKIVSVRFRDLSYGDALQTIEGGDFLDSRLGPKTHSANVVQFSLDDLFILLNLVRPNKIKIDVDGNEAAVLFGSKNLISNATEVYFETSFTESCNDMVQFLIDSGFHETDRSEMYSNNDKSRIACVNLLFKKSCTTDRYLARK